MNLAQRGDIRECWRVANDIIVVALADAAQAGAGRGCRLATSPAEAAPAPLARIFPVRPNG
jgi:hypothetical protein